MPEKKCGNSCWSTLFLMSVLIFFVVGGCSGSAEADSGTSQSPGAKTQCVVTLTVTGMSCGQGCPPRVEKALKKVDGVNAVKVSFETTSATVDCAKQLCSKEGHVKLTSALEAAGFGGSFKSSKSVASAP